MEFIFELIFEFILQVVGNLVFQFLIEIGMRSLVEPFRKSDERHPVFAFIGCILLGTVCGFITLLIMPNAMYHPRYLKGYSLLFIPVACGFSMVALRHLRQKQGKKIVFMDSFVYGYTFAFFMELVRFYKVVNVPW